MRVLSHIRLKKTLNCSVMYSLWPTLCIADVSVLSLLCCYCCAVTAVLCDRERQTLYSEYVERRKREREDRASNKQTSGEGLDPDEGEIGVSLVHVSSKSPTVTSRVAVYMLHVRMI